MVPHARNRTTHSLEGSKCTAVPGPAAELLAFTGWSLKIRGACSCEWLRVERHRRFSAALVADAAVPIVGNRYRSQPAGAEEPRDVSAAMGRLMVLVSLNGSEYAAGLRSPRSEIPGGGRDPQIARLHGHYRRREVFWRTAIPASRYRTTINGF